MEKMAFKNVSARCLQIHFDTKLGTEVLKDSVNFRLDREFVEVHNFDLAHCFVYSTHAYLFMLQCNFLFHRKRGYFVIRDKISNMFLKFSLSVCVTSVKTTVKVPRTLGNFVDSTCHE